MELGYWFVNTAGIGGLVVVFAFAVLLLIYAWVLRWIQAGGTTMSQEDGDHASH